VLVDMYAAFTANTNYKTALMNDELHPNDAGYSGHGVHVVVRPRIRSYPAIQRSTQNAVARPAVVQFVEVRTRS
jgi:hypothetical protein